MLLDECGCGRNGFGCCVRWLDTQTYTPTSINQSTNQITSQVRVFLGTKLISPSTSSPVFVVLFSLLFCHCLHMSDTGSLGFGLSSIDVPSPRAECTALFVLSTPKPPSQLRPQCQSCTLGPYHSIAILLGPPDQILDTLAHGAPH